MPLATELLPSMIERLELDELREWLDAMRERLVWLKEGENNSFKLNIEEVFHYAHFDAEAHRLRQQLEAVGRADGPETWWNQAESITTWLSYLEEALCDVIVEAESKSDLDPIIRWAECITSSDAILTFNYDTLVERALVASGRQWHHGIESDSDAGVPVFKLHGSIDWILAHRDERLSNCDLLFDKKNLNQPGGKSGHVEEDFRLWRCRCDEKLRNWIEGRHAQLVDHGASPNSVGIAGLGAYKQLHSIPGLGPVWVNGMRKLYEADVAVAVGFSMSDFDAMAQMQFAGIARRRAQEGRPLPVLVVDPSGARDVKTRFERVFRTLTVQTKMHQHFDWSRLQ